MNENRVFLLPGELVVKKKPVKIVTLLGSCVAVCLYNRKMKFGGMTHYMLPSGSGSIEERYKYGDVSIKRLVALMKRGDANVRNITARVFGGGAVVRHLAETINMGRKNIETAERELDKHKIHIEDKDVGGTQGRRICFRNWTGEVEVRNVEKSAFTINREKVEGGLSGRKIRVLIVDDSSTVRNLLKKGIESHPGMEVAGTAADAFEARSQLLELDPDVITLDIVMPKMDGVTFLKKIMVYKPKPVIIVSTITQENSSMRRRAEKIGAAGVIDKEDLKIYKGFEAIRTVLCSKIEALSSLPVAKKETSDVKISELQVMSWRETNGVKGGSGML